MDDQSQTAIRPTVTEAYLDAVQLALEQAQSCILNETPEDCSREFAREDTLDKIRRALLDCIPSIRSRLS